MGAAGLRNARITIQTKTVTRSPSGDERETWGTLATVWAKRTDVRGTEGYMAQALVQSVDVVFSLVFIEGVTPESRVTHDGQVFDVERVVRAGTKRRELELYCTSGVRDAR